MLLLQGIVFIGTLCKPIAVEGKSLYRQWWGILLAKILSVLRGEGAAEFWLLSFFLQGGAIADKRKPCVDIHGAHQIGSRRKQYGGPALFVGGIDGGLNSLGIIVYAIGAGTKGLGREGRCMLLRNQECGKGKEDSEAEPRADRGHTPRRAAPLFEKGFHSGFCRLLSGRYSAAYPLDGEYRGGKLLIPSCPGTTLAFCLNSALLYGLAGGNRATAQ